MLENTIRRCNDRIKLHNNWKRNKKLPQEWPDKNNPLKCQHTQVLSYGGKKFNLRIINTVVFYFQWSAEKHVIKRKLSS